MTCSFIALFFSFQWHEIVQMVSALSLGQFAQTVAS